MSTPFRRAGTLVLLAALAAGGCVQSPLTQPSPSMTLGLDPAAAAQRLAEPTIVDWSTRLVVSKQAALLRRSQPPAERSLESLAVAFTSSGNGFAGTAVSGPISAPAFDTQTKQVFWVSQNGWLLRRDLATGQNFAFPISSTNGSTPTDTFPNTNLTLSKDGARVYLCSAQGNFFALDSQTGKNLINSPYPLGGLDSRVGYMPAPYIDEFAGSKSGQVESVYAVTNKGTLYRFYVDGRGTNAPPYILKASTYNITGVTEAGYSPPMMLCAYSPVVINGTALIQIWSNFEEPAYGEWGGTIVLYDTGAKNATTAPMVGKGLGLTNGLAEMAYNQPPVVILNNTMGISAFVAADLFRYDFEEFDTPGYADAESPTIVAANTYANSGALPTNFDNTAPPITPGPATVDPIGDNVFGVSCNALFQINYTDTTNNPVQFQQEILEGKAFNQQSNAWYAKTQLGRTVECAEPGNGQAAALGQPWLGITNTSAPYFDGTSVYVLDNDPDPSAATHVTLNRFTPGNGGPPTLVESIDLTALAPDANQIGGAGLAFDPSSSMLFLTTSSTGASPASRVWGVGI